MRRTLQALIALGLLAAPAQAFVEPVTRHRDLDGDPGAETVRVEPVGVDGTSFRRTKVTISDSCPSGPIKARASGVQDNLERLRLPRADTREGREVFSVLRSGARSVLGEASVVAWRAREGDPCRRKRSLFRYTSDDPTRTPMGGTGDIESFAVRLRNVTGRYAGLEVALDERFQTADDPPTFGSIKKVTYWRYKRSRDRYVHYKTKVRRLELPG